MNHNYLARVQQPNDVAESSPFLVSTGTDPEDVIKNAFGCFDEEGTGQIHEDRLRELLTTMGDRLTDAEVSKQTTPGVLPSLTRGVMR